MDKVKGPGRPKQYNTKTLVLSITIPSGLLKAIDATLTPDQKRSPAIVAMLAQVLNYDVSAQ